MIQILQSLGDGTTRLVNAPVPAASGPMLVVESRASVVSAGTERMLVDFGRANLLEKARRQPDKVRQVMDKVRTDGLVPTLEAVRAKLDAPIPLGYCNAGIVAEVGPRVERFAPGDRVVTNGPHAEFVRVPQTLAARIPDGVSFEAAAFTPLAAIGLQGLRLANPTLGETVVVYGLGLIGLLTVQLARAAGCTVIGIDRAPERVRLAESWGARVVGAGDGVDVAQAVLDLTGGEGADAVLLTLATDSSEPAHAAATMSRKRGRIVLVGVAGLELRRDDFYKKELSFQVSCSYGPGRYDPLHEEKGVDYPAAFVRWTEGRNFAAVLDLMADGRLDPLPLVTHSFPVEEAERAYGVVSGSEPSLGIVLTYAPKDDTASSRARTVTLRARDAAPGRAVVGWIGAGNFASRMLIPAFAKAGATLDTLASAGGVSAAVVGEQAGFRRATTDTTAMLADPALDTIVVTTRHDSHASWTARALGAGKHVFVEKPLALSREELDDVRRALVESGKLLCVGFNRRYAPMVRAAKDALARRSGPLVASITVNAGAIPRDHWTQDRESGGGRVVGEGCHFIDLARFFTGAPVVAMDVRTARAAGRPVDDVALIQLAFADGSVATIHYLANGHRAFPKERVELFHDGNVIRIDNYRRIDAWGIQGLATRWPKAQDKGHAALAAAFVEAVRSGGAPPIPVEELLEVSEWSITAGELAAAGGGSA
ncbi:MAG TPA: bi-domain-containing oxidoreductase [Gemmatimonadaceae bacterium]|nr:bi-domain-containing oxidoreductase [Gemmatimonadaceae bacterium]